jgi:DNA-binding NtrC family response regulator
MAASKRILVVDDEDKIRFVVRHALARLGENCHVETAGNGRDALLLAQKTPFDLVITDLRMPEMDGVALTEALLKQDHNPAVIWMTAYHCASKTTEMKRLGVCCCLDKPIEIGEIRRTVSETLWPCSPGPNDLHPEASSGNP